MRLECLLGEVEERLAEEFFDEIPVEEEENEYIIVANDARIVVPELNMSVREGTCLRYDADEEDYLADFSLTLIYEKDETDPKNYLCWEQYDLIVAIYDYVNRSANMIWMHWKHAPALQSVPNDPQELENITNARGRTSHGRFICFGKVKPRLCRGAERAYSDEKSKQEKVPELK